MWSRALAKQPRSSCASESPAPYAKGVTLGELSRADAEIAMYDEVVRRFEAARELGLREEVARALGNNGVVLGDLNRREEWKLLDLFHPGV